MSAVWNLEDSEREKEMDALRKAKKEIDALKKAEEKTKQKEGQEILKAKYDCDCDFCRFIVKYSDVYCY